MATRAAAGEAPAQSAAPAYTRGSLRTGWAGAGGDYLGGRGVVTQSPIGGGAALSTGSSYFIGATLIALFEIRRKTLRTDIITK